MASLDDVDLKIGRARHHAADFRTLVEMALGKKQTFAFDSGPAADGLYDYRVTGVPEIGPDWALVLGDCVHNLRSALDHLAYQLVLLDGQQPCRQTKFPILKERAMKKGGHEAEPFIQPPIKGREILERIERVQPYFGIGRTLVDEKDSYLWSLSKIDNIDKHRLPLFVACCCREDIWWSGSPDVTGLKVRLSSAPLQEGDPVARFKFKDGRFPSSFEPHAMLRIVIREDETPLLEDQNAELVLGRLVNEVATVVDLFRPLFTARLRN